MNYQKELEKLSKKYENLKDNYGAVYTQLHDERKRHEDTLKKIPELRALVNSVLGAVAMQFGTEGKIVLEKFDPLKFSALAERDENGNYIITAIEIMDILEDGEGEEHVEQLEQEGSEEGNEIPFHESDQAD
jgi:hypothetical protein